MSTTVLHLLVVDRSTHRPDADRLEGWERSPRLLFVALVAATALVALPFALPIALYDRLAARLAACGRRLRPPSRAV